MKIRRTIVILLFILLNKYSFPQQKNKSIFIQLGPSCSYINPSYDQKSNPVFSLKPIFASDFGLLVPIKKIDSNETYSINSGLMYITRGVVFSSTSFAHPYDTVGITNNYKISIKLFRVPLLLCYYFPSKQQNKFFLETGGAFNYFFQKKIRIEDGDNTNPVWGIDKRKAPIYKLNDDNDYIDFLFNAGWSRQVSDSKYFFFSLSFAYALDQVYYYNRISYARPISLSFIIGIQFIYLKKKYHANEN